MKSTQELYAEKHEEKLAAMEKARRAAIENGLHRLDSLDEDKIAQELPDSAYVKHAHTDLAKIMRTKQYVLPEDEEWLSKSRGR